MAALWHRACYATKAMALPVSASPPGSSIQRVLAVDDDADCTELTRLTLEGTGRYLVCEVNDPQMAAAAARDFQPDLVLMDVDMPHLDGRAAALLIQSEKRLEAVPILFMSSMFGEDVSAAKNPFGWFGPIAKPVPAKQLLSAVDAILHPGPKTK